MTRYSQGYSPLIARRWATVSLTPKQLTQALRDLSLIPEDARFYDISIIGNPLTGLRILLTYESDTLDYENWESRPQEELTIMEENDLESNSDMLSGWDTGEEET